MDTCDADTLSTDARCFIGMSDAARSAILIVLLCNLTNAINTLADSAATVSGQILQYNADPTLEGVIPTDMDSPAVAYPAGGQGTTYTWNTTTHVWQ